MTVTATSYTPLTYNGNGSTTVFNVTFQFFELAVYHIDSSGTETTWTENTHYTVTGGEGSTGSITVKTTPTDYTPATGEQLRIERVTSKDQPRDYDLDNAVLEDALQQSDDRLAMILQELDYDNRRRPAISKANFTAAVEFPTASTGSVLSWGSDGNLANTALLDLDGVAISALTTTTSLEDTDLLPIYDNSAGDNASITWANFEASIDTTPADGSISTAKLADNAVTTAKILDDAVTTDKIEDNAVTLAKMEHGTSGDILYYGASGEPFRLAKGADDQVLKLSSGLPAWQDNQAVDAAQLCSAWVHFNGTGTVSIYDSYNINSLTDLGTGWYRLHFENSLANTNYSVVGGSTYADDNAGVQAGGIVSISRKVGAKNVAYVDIYVAAYNSSAQDHEFISVQIFGGV